MSEKTAIDSFPFTKHLTAITKRYVGIISEKLQNLEIDRCFYPMILIEKEDCRLTQQLLAEKLDIDKVSMVRMIDYLSGKGYVKRKKNPDDRREHLLEITTKGKKVVPQIKQAFYETNQEAFFGLSAEEVSSFLHHLKIIKNNLADIPAVDVKLRFNRISKSKTQYEKEQLSDA